MSLKRPGNPGWYFKVLNCAPENGWSSETCGRLSDRVTPRSASNCDEGLPPLVADLQEEALPAFISNGREEVVHFFRNFVGLMLEDMSHTTHNHGICVDGDRASGDCDFELTARDASPSAPMTDAGCN